MLATGSYFKVDFGRGGSSRPEQDASFRTSWENSATKSRWSPLIHETVASSYAEVDRFPPPILTHNSGYSPAVGRHSQVSGVRDSGNGMASNVSRVHCLTSGCSSQFVQVVVVVNIYSYDYRY